MDYLLLPRNPTHDLIEVPFLCTENYDGGDFFTYPLRQGWGPRSAWDWQRVFEDHSEQVSGFLQTWLMFGTMEHVFTRPFNIFEFACRSKSSDDMILTMAPFRRLLHQHIRNTTYQDGGAETFRVLFYNIVISAYLERSPSYKSITDGSKETDILGFLRSIHFKKSIDPRILLSISVMNTVLFEAAGREGMGRSIADSYARPTYDLPFNSLIYFRMREDGWCPSQLFRMCKLLNHSAMYFMSHIERPDTSRAHHMIRIKPPPGPSLPVTSQMNQNRYWSGEVCNQHKCVMYHFDDTTYRTKHAEGCTGCYEMVADYEEIYDILKSGSIPLILSIDAADSSHEIRLVESGSDVEYVAISHVWSDGLGNVQRSALPRCQMLRLSNLIRTLPGKASNLVLFWIDTIGCPPDAANKGAAQALAISMMRQTYENAYAVLVLESWIQATNVGQMTDLEAILRILCCSWNTRLWTLQEGALAQNLLSQFADMAYDLDGGLENLRKLDDSILECSMRGVITQRIRDLRVFKNRDTEVFDKLTAAIYALAFRSTSVATDEALCLATLLDMDVMKLYQEPPEERMIHFWRSFDTVPLKFLNLNHPKLQTPGLRWAPSTLLRSPTELSLILQYSTVSDKVAGRTDEAGARTEEGLLFQKDGWVFWTGDSLLPETFYVRLEDGKLNCYTCGFSKNAEATNHQEIENDDTTGGLKLNVVEHYCTREIAFLGSTSTTDLGTYFTRIGEGLLVAVTKTVDDIIYGRVLCKSSRHFIPPEDNTKGVAGLRAMLSQVQPHSRYVVRNRLNGQLVCALGETKKPSQYWCIE